MSPGMNPLSTAPTRKRTAENPAKFWVTPVKVVTTPQLKVRAVSQNLGVVSLRAMLHGTSNKT